METLVKDRVISKTKQEELVSVQKSSPAVQSVVVTLSAEERLRIQNLVDDFFIKFLHLNKDAIMKEAVRIIILERNEAAQSDLQESLKINQSNFTYLNESGEIANLKVGSTVRFAPSRMLKLDTSSKLKGVVHKIVVVKALDSEFCKIKSGNKFYSKRSNALKVLQ